MPRLKLQQGLVVTQIALLMLLLVGAGLFARTLAKLQSMPLGFNPENVLLFDINAPQAGYPEAGAAAYYTAAARSLRGDTRRARGHAVACLDDQGRPRSSDQRSTASRLEGTYRLMQTGPRFFSTMQIPLLAGREFDERDLRRPWLRA